MTARRASHTATLLNDGKVLIAGGNDYTNAFPPVILSSAELYIPSILIPTPVVKTVRFDRVVVPAGSSYSVDLSGSNLTPEMFFDVRFIGPGSNESAVVLNWQRGLAVKHDVPAGTPLGAWIINGVRAHEIETDHTGIFFPWARSVAFRVEISAQAERDAEAILDWLLSLPPPFVGSPPLVLRCSSVR